MRDGTEKRTAPRDLANTILVLAHRLVRDATAHLATVALLCFSLHSHAAFSAPTSYAVLPSPARLHRGAVSNIGHT